ncbi:hypothetical protein C367_02474 [Cryptococcus neoformans Ze90-1]|nr:hypothetical protein C367_02474 [Cryptococcus neoformans var. grubii Ze90-1]
MPFLQTLNDLKDLTNSINPLNFLSPDHQSSPAPSPSTSPARPAAPLNQSEAGPGPSSLASRNAVAVNQRSVYSSPADSPRPSPKHSSSSSLPPSSDSAESVPVPRGAGAANVTGRRKSSGTSVVIAEPEVTNMARGRQKRPPSVASGISGFGDDGFSDRRGKKNPSDTYIIVKPPPATAKNPLNLQIQLVVKRNRRERGVSTSSNYSSLASPSSPADDRDVKSQSPATPNPQSSDPMLPSASMPTRSSSLPASATTSDVSDEEVSVKRSSSIRSGMSNATSSTGSGMSGKRIEPMFNLAVHNVVHPTVVTDAATDVKVAKFHKRVVDVSGVGIVEPSEIHLPSASNHLYPTISRVTSHVTSDGESLQTPSTKARPRSIASFSPSLSPVHTAHQEDSRGIRSSLELKGFRLDNLLHQKPDSGDSNTKKLFGKIFKKKKNGERTENVAINMSRSGSTSSIDPKSTSGMPLDAVSTNGSAAAGRASIHLPSTASDFHHSSPSAIGYPTFGTSPTIVVRQPPSVAQESRLKPELYSPTEKHHTAASPTVSSRSRPIGYNWTVRRWARRNSEGWAAHLVAAAAAGLEFVGAAEMAGENEVQFEWVKGVSEPDEKPRQRTLMGIGKPGISPGQPKGRAVSAPGRSTSTGTGPKSSRRIASPMPSTPSSPVPSRPPSPSLDGRPEPVRRVSAAASTSSSTASSKGVPSVAFDGAVAGGDMTAEEGDSSETEDSETPWSCWVWVKNTGQRQLLGTLTPAPHHPKVVGVLKIPMSLDPVSLTDIKGPVLNANGEQGHQTAMAMKKIKENVALTEENLKDMICVTALWLVAREEYGGLGRVGGGRRRRRGRKHA